MDIGPQAASWAVRRRSGLVAMRMQRLLRPIQVPGPSARIYENAEKGLDRVPESRAVGDTKEAKVCFMRLPGHWLRQPSQRHRLLLSAPHDPDRGAQAAGGCVEAAGGRVFLCNVDKAHAVR